MAIATIIAKTVADLGRIVSATEHALGINVARCVDERTYPPHPSEALTMVLERFGPQNVPTSFYQKHSSISVLIAMDEADFADIAVVFSGMNLVTSCLRRGMFLVVTASLSDWQHAIEDGLSPASPDNIRHILTSIYHAFEDDKLRLWNHLDRSTDGSNNIYLEAK